jgi:hypothetical protein
VSHGGACLLVCHVGEEAIGGKDSFDAFNTNCVLFICPHLDFSLTRSHSLVRTHLLVTLHALPTCSLVSTHLLNHTHSFVHHSPVCTPSLTHPPPSRYSEDDFLNQHDDAIGDDRLPTWAFVVSLTKGQWKEGFGGELEYLTARAGTTQTWSEHHLIPGTQHIAAPLTRLFNFFLSLRSFIFLSRV